MRQGRRASKFREVRGTMFCSNCGTKVNDNANFCPQCGATVNGENQTTGETVQHSIDNKKKLNILGIVGIVVAAVVAVVVFITLALFVFFRRI